MFPVELIPNVHEALTAVGDPRKIGFPAGFLTCDLLLYFLNFAPLGNNEVLFLLCHHQMINFSSAMNIMRNSQKVSPFTVLIF